MNSLEEGLSLVWLQRLSTASFWDPTRAASSYAAFTGTLASIIFAGLILLLGYSIGKVRTASEHKLTDLQAVPYLLLSFIALTSATFLYVQISGNTSLVVSYLEIQPVEFEAATGSATAILAVVWLLDGILGLSLPPNEARREATELRRHLRWLIRVIYGLIAIFLIAGLAETPSDPGALGSSSTPSLYAPLIWIACIAIPSILVNVYLLASVRATPSLSTLRRRSWRLFWLGMGWVVLTSVLTILLAFPGPLPRMLEAVLAWPRAEGGLLLPSLFGVWLGCNEWYARLPQELRPRPSGVTA